MAEINRPESKLSVIDFAYAVSPAQFRPPEKRLFGQLIVHNFFGRPTPPMRLVSDDVEFSAQDVVHSMSTYPKAYAKLIKTIFDAQ